MFSLGLSNTLNWTPCDGAVTQRWGHRCLLHKLCAMAGCCSTVAPLPQKSLHELNLLIISTPFTASSIALGTFPQELKGSQMFSSGSSFKPQEGSGQSGGNIRNTNETAETSGLLLWCTYVLSDGNIKANLMRAFYYNQLVSACPSRSRTQESRTTEEPQCEEKIIPRKRGIKHLYL